MRSLNLQIRRHRDVTFRKYGTSAFIRLHALSQKMSCRQNCRPKGILYAKCLYLCCQSCTSLLGRTLYQWHTRLRCRIFLWLQSAVCLLSKLRYCQSKLRKRNHCRPISTKFSFLTGKIQKYNTFIIAINNNIGKIQIAMGNINLM